MALDTSIPARTVALIHSEAWPVGSHRPAQKLADRLRGALPDDFTEALLRKTCGATQGEVDAVLARIAGEGWAEEKPGYGWVFSPLLTTPDSLLQSYRMRLALEPAALLVPGYRLAPSVIERLRSGERHLLGGGIETNSAVQLHGRGVRRHEALVNGSRYEFFIDTVRRVNRVRRRLSYRSMQGSRRYKAHARQHPHLLDLLARQRNEEASEAMRNHLGSTLRNITQIQGLLKA